MDWLQVGVDTADCTVSNPQCMAAVSQFHTVATAKTPGDPVVSGARGLLRGFFFSGYVSGCLFGLYAQSPMEDVPRQPKEAYFGNYLDVF
jgi:hypothetical protein